MIDFNDPTEPVVFRPSRVVYGAEFIGGWTIIAVWVFGARYLGFHGVFLVIAYSFFAIMGLASILTLTMLLPGAVEIRLTPTGYIMKFMFHEASETPWSDYLEFGAVAPFQDGIREFVRRYAIVDFRKRVMCNYSDAYKGKINQRLSGSNRLNSWKRRLEKTKNRTGYERVFPCRFGSQTEEVARQMEKFRQRAEQQENGSRP